MESSNRIGDYEILEELGRGGMGRVYKVRNVISDRIEAMKVLLPDLVGRDDLAARFVREIKVLATLHHPHIASLRTALTADNQLVMIMEFVEGQSLAHRLRAGAVPVDDAIQYVAQVLDALNYAHGLGVVHRDIKPANMMLAPGGVVKLTDFGIARSQNDQTLTVAGTTTGSLSYMSPEQVNGETCDGRSDLYSVGISLYELVTGQRPFRADSDFGVMIAHLKEMPRPPIELQPALGSDLNAVIMKSISKDPADRYQTSAEFRDALLALVPGAADSAVPATSPATAPAMGMSSMPTELYGVASAAAAAATPTAPLAGRQTVLNAPAVASTVPGVPMTGQVPSVPLAASDMPAAAPTPPMPTTKQGHPAAYVALGGVLMIGALVAAGLYIGRADARPSGSIGTAAAPTQAPAAPAAPAASATTAVVPPAGTSATSAAPNTAAPITAAVPSAPDDTPPSAATAAAPSSSAPAIERPASAAAGAPAGRPASTASSASSAPPAPRTPPVREPRPPAAPAATASRPPAAPPAATSAAAAQVPASAVSLDELETEIDQLFARASAVDESISRMQQEQARSGFGMRGDVVAQREQMKVNIGRAQQAIGQRDGERARRYRDLAEANVAFLEKFLGR